MAALPVRPAPAPLPRRLGLRQAALFVPAGPLATRIVRNYMMRCPGDFPAIRRSSALQIERPQTGGQKKSGRADLRVIPKRRRSRKGKLEGKADRSRG